MNDSRKPEMRLKSRITQRMTPRITRIIGIRGSQARQLQHYSFGFAGSPLSMSAAHDRIRLGEKPLKDLPGSGWMLECEALRSSPAVKSLAVSFCSSFCESISRDLIFYIF